MLVDVVRGLVEALNRRALDGYAAAFHKDAERSVPSVAEFRDGKVARGSSYGDPTEMAAQLAGGGATA